MQKIAAIQMCSSTDVDENLKSAEELISQAAKNGAKLIVLPEMFPIIGTVQEKIGATEKLGSGKIQDFLAATAKKNKIWIVGGTIPIASGNKARAACLIFNDEGERVARYDKIHLFDVNIPGGETHRESDTVEPGEEAVVVDTPFGKLGVAVCYDIRFPALFMRLFERGAEIIAVPAAFTVKTGEAHWILMARARAVENFSYFIGACQAGIHASGRKTYGNSVIVDPWGKILAQASSENPEILYAEIDLEYLKKIRTAIPVTEHHKIIK